MIGCAYSVFQFLDEGHGCPDGEKGMKALFPPRVAFLSGADESVKEGEGGRLRIENWRLRKKAYD